jgi:hypothetical protein
VVFQPCTKVCVHIDRIRCKRTRTTPARSKTALSIQLKGSCFPVTKASAVKHMWRISGEKTIQPSLKMLNQIPLVGHSTSQFDGNQPALANSSSGGTSCIGARLDLDSCISSPGFLWVPSCVCSNCVTTSSSRGRAQKKINNTFFDVGSTATSWLSYTCFEAIRMRAAVGWVREVWLEKHPLVDGVTPTFQLVRRHGGAELC